MKREGSVLGRKKNSRKSMNFGVRKSELKVQFCHLVVVGP